MGLGGKADHRHAGTHVERSPDDFIAHNAESTRYIGHPGGTNEGLVAAEAHRARQIRSPVRVRRPHLLFVLSCSLPRLVVSLTCFIPAVPHLNRPRRPQNT